MKALILLIPTTVPVKSLILDLNSELEIEKENYLKKSSSLLNKIENGSYGYCEETGEEIGLRRLEARPVATLCLEAQERREIKDKQYSEGDDYLR